MAWLQLKLPCTDKQAETLSDLLFELSAVSVTFEDAADEPIFEPSPGSMPLWAQTNVIALFEEDADLVTVYAVLQNKFPEIFQHHILERVEDQEWEKAYFDSFQPIKIANNLWICPTWHEPPEPHATNIMLDPGVAFGTGTHPTTQLCLQALSEINLKDKTVIDYGCGSGILAIAALKLGAHKVIAVDIHEQALEATEQNASTNKLLDKIVICHPDKLTNEPVDVVVANILAEPLIILADKIVRLLNPNGQLILSGLLREQSDDVKKPYRTLELQDEKSMEEWACLRLLKPA